MVVRVANGQGFWGDSQDAPRVQVERGSIDYLGLDYLAEITMSIMQKQKARDPKQGYARDFVVLMKDILPTCKRKGIKVVTNAGGLNPEECRRQVVEVARSLGLSGVRVASVTGDDILDRLPQLLAQGIELCNLDTGEPLASVLDRVVAANAYLGAAPIAQALDQGADVVITGRCTDPALVLGPLLHEFRWAPTDFDRLAQGVIAGHLLECGAQVTGGNFEGGWWQVPDLANVGFPIAEVTETGEFTITKHEGTGGLVSFHTVMEQLLYEMGDPANYISPEVICDLREATVEETGPNRVTVRGVRGRAPSEFYKVSVAYRNGYSIVGTLVYSWPGAVQKAQKAAEILRRRAADLGLRYEDMRVDLVGLNAVHGHLAPRMHGEVPEVMLRVAMRGPYREDLERFGMEFAPLVLAGPACGTGFADGRPKPSEIVEYWPALVPKGVVTAVVEVEEV